MTDSTERQSLLPPAKNVAWVAAGGAIGGTLRFGFIAAFPIPSGQFPWVVFLENATGAFALGLLLTILLRRTRPGWDMRPFLARACSGPSPPSPTSHSTS